MEDINICDCCKDIWNRENLIKFNFTNNHKLFICPDCLKEMTNGDIVKTMFPNVKLDDGGKWRHIFWGVQAKASFSQDWWDTPYYKDNKVL